MKRKLEIEYNWESESGSAIPARHEEALQETALILISERLLDGYVEGELFDNIHFSDEEDGEDGIAYTGYWKSKLVKI